MFQSHEIAISNENTFTWQHTRIVWLTFVCIDKSFMYYAVELFKFTQIVSSVYLLEIWDYLISFSISKNACLHIYLLH